MTPVRVPCILGLAMVTDTPGRTPPEESVTFPLIAPVVALTCAKAGDAAIATHNPKTTATILFIAPPKRSPECKHEDPDAAAGHDLLRRGDAKAEARRCA